MKSRNARIVGLIILSSIVSLSILESTSARERRLCRFRYPRRCVSTCQPSSDLRCPAVSSCLPCYGSCECREPCVFPQYPVSYLGGGWYLYAAHDHPDCCECNVFNLVYVVYVGLPDQEVCTPCANVRLIQRDQFPKPNHPELPTQVDESFELSDYLVEEYTSNSGHQVNTVDFTLPELQPKIIRVRQGESQFYARVFYVYVTPTNAESGPSAHFIAVGVELRDPPLADDIQDVVNIDFREAIDTDPAVKYCYRFKLNSMPHVVYASQ